jgi:hypothetical protein
MSIYYQSADHNGFKAKSIYCLRPPAIVVIGSTSTRSVDVCAALRWPTPSSKEFERMWTALGNVKL